ncbi:MAG: S-layer homology domain-containing protein [Bifidobacteriaceae bacterium]|nr:S-layer homology domain-containing protein [Bifidobacteriaceae bacterium]
MKRAFAFLFALAICTTGLVAANTPKAKAASAPGTLKVEVAIDGYNDPFLGTTVIRDEVNFLTFTTNVENEGNCPEGTGANAGYVGDTDVTNSVWVCWESESQEVFLTTTASRVIANVNSSYLFSFLDQWSGSTRLTDPKFDLASVENASHMFEGTHIPQNLGIPEVLGRNASDMSYMFAFDDLLSRPKPYLKLPPGFGSQALNMEGIFDDAKLDNNMILPVDFGRMATNISKAFKETEINGLTIPLNFGIAAANYDNLFQQANITSDIFLRQAVSSEASGANVFQNAELRTHKIWVPDQTTFDKFDDWGLDEANLMLSAPLGMLKTESVSPSNFLGTGIQRNAIRGISFATGLQERTCSPGFSLPSPVSDDNLGGLGAENSVWACWSQTQSELRISTNMGIVRANPNISYLFSGLKNLVYLFFDSFTYQDANNFSYIFANSVLPQSFLLPQTINNKNANVTGAFSGVKWNGHKIFVTDIGVLNLLTKNGSGANAKEITLLELPIAHADTPRFNDIGKLTKEFQDAIKWLYKYGITAGRDAYHYDPSGSVNRGQMALFLYREAGSPASASTSCGFSDIGKLSTEGKKAVCWLKTVNITGGTPDASHFSPSKGVTRNQMAAFLYRFADSPAWGQTSCGFVDTGKLSTDAKKSICWLKATGITTGTDKTHYSPTKSVSRAAMAAFLNREYNWIRVI